MAREFLGRVAIVTGAREGMGFASAELLAEGGAGLVLVSRNEEQLKDVGNQISLKTKNKNVVAVAGDVGKVEDVKNVVDRSMERFGKIDYLLNFAGYNRDYPRISPMRPSPAAIDTLERVVNTDLLGTARMVFQVEPIMRKQKHGVIITVGSTPVIDRWENDLLFQIAKVGNKQMTEVIAEQHRADGVAGVRIYWVAPGNVRNPSTFEAMSTEQLKAADADGWLDSRLHVASLISSLLTGKLKRESGATIRIDSLTAPQLFAEVGEQYTPLTKDMWKELKTLHT